jgi:hypothetical protein
MQYTFPIFFVFAMTVSNFPMFSMASPLAAPKAARISLRSFPICHVTKCDIINSLWGLSIWPLDISSGKVNYDSYFSYYSEQCNLALYDGERHISAKSHQDIIEIAEQIRSHVDRKDIMLWLSSRLPFPRLENEEERINGSIDLVVRLLCMINVGELQYGFSGQERLMWSENSLEHWIKNYFHAPRLLDNEHVKLEKIFSALNLGRIAGIEIQFTNNLADHLRLMGEDDKKVSIFHNASFLMIQRNK